MSRFVVISSLLSISLAGPAAFGQQQDQPAAVAESGTHRIGPGDRLKITVYNADKLSGEYPVGGDGKVGLPMLGRVPVSGLTLDGAADVVALRLRDGYMLAPSVTVDMVAYRSVFVLGEVGKPGQYPYVEGMTVLQLVAQAGGFTYRANRGTIKRRGEGDTRDAKEKVARAAPIRPGDTVVVMQRYF